MSTVFLDDFESDALRVIQPGQPVSNPEQRYLWNQYNAGTYNSGPGLASITSSLSRRGASSLRVVVSGGNLYLQFYPNDGVAWLNLRQFVQPSSSWVLDTFNRMRCWMRVPQQIRAFDSGQANCQFGTYVRARDGSPYSAEDGGWHFYHFFDIPYTGEWHQLVLDTHPNHVRGASGGTEHGDKPYPTGDGAYNYFDALTRFYITFLDTIEMFPVEFHFDAFELYQETRTENVQQVYSLNGVYVPTQNRVRVGWMRHKDENTIKHEVRYAFEDILSTGWSAATPAPNGLLVPQGWQGYNGMVWETTEIDLQGRTMVYVAVKPENTALFRQIAVPITDTLVNPPSPPLLTDVVAPLILWVIPAVGRMSVTKVCFNESMNSTSINAQTFLVRDTIGPVLGTVTYNAELRIASFAPVSKMRANTVHTAIVRGGTSGVLDVAGNPLAGDYIWSFTTK